VSLAVLGALIGIIATSLPAAQGSAGGSNAGGGGGNTPTGGRSAPQLDASAMAMSVDGAQAYVRYWFATLNYAVDSGQTGPLSAASNPACQACAAIIKA